MPFTPTAQAAVNEGKLIKCTECRKPRLIKNKLSPQNLLSLKGVLNHFQYVHGTILQDVLKDDWDSDSQITELAFCRKNLSCFSLIEIPYFSNKIHPLICVHCGQLSALLLDTPELCSENAVKQKLALKKQKLHVFRLLALSILYFRVDYPQNKDIS